ncbi:hypothetical protein BASA62_008150 [Batrachochytrium salamandrivorans]|nr:hypothetical protein BASA62_008150 [Batrachochytrium salamandrivorans]
MISPNVDTGSDTNPFSGEQEGASHSFNELDLSDSTTRTMSETPSNNDPDIPFGGQPEQQLEEAYSSDAITVGGKARISPCPDGSILKGPSAKCGQLMQQSQAVDPRPKRRAEELIKEIQNDMEKVKEAYNRQRSSYEGAKDIFISLIPSVTLSSFGLDGDINHSLE